MSFDVEYNADRQESSIPNGYADTKVYQVNLCYFVASLHGSELQW